MQKNIYRIFFFIFISLFSFGNKFFAQSFITPSPVKSVKSSKAMVCSAHPLATEAGYKILKAGGNAVDAAIAVQFALAVVYPQAGNIGGGGFQIYRDPNGNYTSLDYREKAPFAAHRDMYLDSLGNAITQKSQKGHLAAGVPGSVSGMEMSFKKFSKLKSWKKLIQPAIDLAEKGFVITEQEANNLNKLKEEFVLYNTHTPVFVKETAWKAGDILIQEDLAKTLKAIRKKGAKGFYEGKVARYIVEEMKKGGGLISLEDLKSYQAKFREPQKFYYKGYEVVSMPPPSSGGIALNQLLKMTEHFPMSKHSFQSSEAVQTMVEIERRVYSDRAKHLGDSDFYPVPSKQLVDSVYLHGRIQDIQSDKATPSSTIKAGNFSSIKESEQTTHLSIVDADGGACSVTTTLNDSYGCRTVVNGAGFILNNEMDDFSIKPGVPNIYGLIGGEANSIQAQKRMLSSMTPTIIAKDNQLKLVVGTPGGSTIITSVYQVIINILDFGMSATEAVQAPRFHHQWLPDLIYVEKKALSKEVRDKLTSMGYTIKERENIGRVEAILVLPDKTLEGAADIRGDDHVMGF